jgi:hypothetical protein
MLFSEISLSWQAEFCHHSATSGENTLKLEASNFKCCFLALGESTGISDAAQLVILVKVQVSVMLPS